MQNEELKRAQVASEESRDKYLDLYDFAPVGYFTLTPKGRVVEVNLAGAALLGVARSKLVRCGLGRFVAPEDLDRWDRHLLSVMRSDQKQTCELTLKREDGSTFFAQLDSIRLDRPTEESGTGDAGPVIRAAMSDISDRKRAQRITARYALISKHARDPILLIHSDGRIMEANEAALVFYGYTSDELLSLRIQNLRQTDDRDLVRRQMEQARTVGIQFETMHVRKDGTKVPVEVSSKSISIDGEQMLLSVIRDITALKRAEALLSARLRLSELAQHAGMDEVMRAALDEAERLTGSCMGFFHFVSEDQENVQLQTWSTNTLKNMCQAEGKGRHYPISQAGVWVDGFHARAPVIHNDYASLGHKKGLPEGHAPLVRDVVVPILRQGLVVAIMGVGNKATDYTQDDVTALQALAGPVMDLVTTKQAEGVLQQARERLKEIVRLAPAFMCILRGREHVFEMCNDKYFEVVGRRDILNLPVRQALPELEGQGFFELLDGVFETGKSYSGKEVPVRLQRTPGGPLEEMSVDFVYMPLHEADGSISGIFVHGVDVTEQLMARRRIEEHAQERQRAAEELKRSNKDLEQFAYVASHDLQEPLRTVTGFVQLLKKKYGNRLDSEADQFIEFAVDGAKRMEALIKDLLSYARVGSQSRQLAPTDVAAAVRQAVDNLGTSIREAAGEITYGELPTVRADGSQLVQLFQNLIGNAMKFRGEEPPKIHVDASRQDDHWLFSVRDNGIGIAPESRDRIFLIFQRLNTRTQYSGTGIGLAICKKIVNCHGGSIWVESQPGQGATFRFTIPI